MTSWNFADVWEAIAEVQPDAPALIRGSSIRSWSEFEQRASAVGDRLLSAGLTRQSRVAQYLMNSMEYVESLFATFKAAMVPVNTNYRYVADELAYLWLDAGVEAVMFHGSFTEAAAQVRLRVPDVKLWLWVDDGVGECPDWAESFEAVATSGASLRSNAPVRTGDDLYLLYTGGTTGQPKGVMWRQDDLFCVLNRSATLKYPEDGDLVVVQTILLEAGAERARVIPAAPLMHGTAAFSAFAILDSGGAVVLCEHTKFDPEELLDTIERHGVTDLSIVGDAFAKPLLDALNANPNRWDITSLKVMLSSGVMWSAPVKDGLIGHAPNLLCVDTLGSSEAVGLARSISSSRGTAKTAGFKLGPDAQVIREDGTSVKRVLLRSPVGRLLAISTIPRSRPRRSGKSGDVAGRLLAILHRSTKTEPLPCLVAVLVASTPVARRCSRKRLKNQSSCIRLFVMLLSWAHRMSVLGSR